MLKSFKHLVVFINRTEMIYLKRPLMFSNNQIHSKTIIDSSINFPFFSVAGAGGRGLNPRPDPVESLGTFGKWHFLILVYTIVLGLVVAFQDTVGLDFLAPRNIAYQCDYFGCVHFTVIASVNVHRTYAVFLFTTVTRVLAGFSCGISGQLDGRRPCPLIAVILFCLD